MRWPQLRGGYGQTVDKLFKRNASECNRLGIPCGVYWFSYALSTVGAEREAACSLGAIQSFKFHLLGAQPLIPRHPEMRLKLRRIFSTNFERKGYSGADIAKLYGVDQRQVGAWISRAAQKLKKDAA